MEIQWWLPVHYLALVSIETNELSISGTLGAQVLELTSFQDVRLYNRNDTVEVRFCSRSVIKNMICLVWDSSKLRIWLFLIHRVSHLLIKVFRDQRRICLEGFDLILKWKIIKTWNKMIFYLTKNFYRHERETNLSKILVPLWAFWFSLRVIHFLS